MEESPFIAMSRQRYENPANYPLRRMLGPSFDLDQSIKSAQTFGSYVAPGLTDYLTKDTPPPSYSPNAVGKIPEAGANPYEAGALWDVFNLGTNFLPGGAPAKVAMTAAPLAAKGLSTRTPKLLEVFRGGRTPLFAADVPERIAGLDAIELYAHTNPNIAAEYGNVSKFHIDTSKVLDARTPEGLEAWTRLTKGKGDPLGAVEKAGYKGAIYPDPHDWGFPTEGHEVVIFDRGALKLRADK